MTRDELVELIQDELTVSSGLPNSISPKEIERIIKNSERWFYINYKNAVESDYYVIPHSYFTSTDFTSRRFVQLPDCVMTIQDFREIRGGSRIGIVDRDITENKIIASELFLSSVTGDDLVMRTAQYAYWDLTKAYFLDTIAYTFNQNTKRIKISGRNPRTSSIIKCFSKIPQESLYDDDLFIRWVFGKSKIALGYMYTLYTYQLPGGVTINGSILKDAGEKELQEVKDQIDKESPPDWFLLFN
jgi:hypothetical protein